MVQPGIGHCSTRYSRPRAFASFSRGMNTCSKKSRFPSIDSFWLRPTKPHTAGHPSAAAASSIRTTNLCFFARRSLSSCKRLSKNAMSVTPTPVACMAARTRRARVPSNGLRRSRVFATGSSIASGGTSASVGCRAADICMLGQSISRANANQSSIARSGSASRIWRGVSSCSAAVSTLIFMNFGSKALGMAFSGLVIRNLLARGANRTERRGRRGYAGLCDHPGGSFPGAESRCGPERPPSRTRAWWSDRCTRRS